MAVKDIFDTADAPTECGTPIHAGRRPAFDAAAVAAIRAAGGVVMGKSVTTECAYAHPGPTTNPHDAACTPGGSSSGSAALVAAGATPLAIGTQTAGSVIRPAAFCGVVGFKPSFGLISRRGVMPCSESVDTVGAFARDVADAWLLIEAMTGARRPRALSDPARAPRIGFCRTSEWDAAAPESRDAVEVAARRLEQAGAVVTDVALPAAAGDLQRLHKDIMAHEASRALAPERRAAPEKLSPALTALLEEGDALSPSGHGARLAAADAARRAVEPLFETVDLLLTPSAPGEAPPTLATTGDAVFNRVWTLLHGPAIHLPTGAGQRGLPVGVQLVGPRGGDIALSAFAAWAAARL